MSRIQLATQAAAIAQKKLQEQKRQRQESWHKALSASTLTPDRPTSSNRPDEFDSSNQIGDSSLSQNDVNDRHQEHNEKREDFFAKAMQPQEESQEGETLFPYEMQGEMTIQDMVLYHKRRKEKMKEEEELIRSVRLRILAEKKNKCFDEETVRYWTETVQQTDDGKQQPTEEAIIWKQTQKHTKGPSKCSLCCKRIGNSCRSTCGPFERTRMRIIKLTDKTLVHLEGHLSLAQAIIVLILNFFLPTSGTFASVHFINMDILAIKQKELKEEDRIKMSFVFHRKQLMKDGRRLACYQLSTLPLLLFGWLWALYFSIKLLFVARKSAS